MPKRFVPQARKKQPNIETPGSSSKDDRQLNTDPELWRRIQQHDFDLSQAELTFSEKLEVQNGWTQEFTLRVIDEYRKFVYLACLSDKELTPSDEVDQAWHLHLTYTRDYWGEFCENVLKRPLHHGPTQGGPVEEQRYEENYEYTKAIYQEVFQEVPANDIWPPPCIRFGLSDKMVRINQRLFKIVAKKTWLAAIASSSFFRLLPLLGPVGLIFAILDIIPMSLAIGIILLTVTLTVIANNHFREFNEVAVATVFPPQSEVIIQRQHEHLISYKVARPRDRVVAVHMKRIPPHDLSRRGQRGKSAGGGCGAGSNGCSGGGCSGGGGGCGGGGG